MLNRRLLRIKAMQALYAYKQAQESNYELALDSIREDFEPDLDSMEKQDRELLRRHASIGVGIFEKSYQNREIAPNAEANPQINHSVVKAIDFYYRANQKDRQFHLREMLLEVDLLYDNYLSILLFGIEMAKMVSQQRDSKKMSKLNVKVVSEYKFAYNATLQTIAEHAPFQEKLLRRDISWGKEKEIVQFFLQQIKKDAKYQAYVALGDSNAEQDWQIADYIFREFLFKKAPDESPEDLDELQAFFEKSDINWAENREILKSMVLKTLKKAKEHSESGFTLAEVLQDEKDDKIFFENLYTQTLADAPVYEPLIAEKSKNWKTERFAVIDRILIEMAISEMIHCTSIPIKVSINEYIELAKNYSTPKSKIFINGLLNTLAETMKEQGIIRKSGKGLLDNK